MIVLIHSEQKIYTVSLTLTCDLELKIPQAMVPFDSATRRFDIGKSALELGVPSTDTDHRDHLI